MRDNEYFNQLFKQVVLRDDENALKEIFFEFYPSLCVFAERYINDFEVCRDIVQETFFKLWKNRKQIDITESFRNYLITSVRNNCIDYLRKYPTNNSHNEFHKTSAFQIDSPEDIYTLNELQQKINDALKELPENLRQAFELNRFQDMTYVQIAQKMNISVKTVESYISRALKILRTELKDYLPFLLLFLQ